MLRCTRKETVMGMRAGMAVAASVILQAAPAEVFAAPRTTAGAVVALIQENVGVEWQKETVDTFKGGSAATPVTGIAVTMMATMDVLQRASASGLNMVITHEPTYYAHLDTPEGIEASDPVWTAKREFVEKRGMAVWRFHDHWHMRSPDGIEAGMVHALGWERFQRKDDPYLFVMPETTVEALAQEVAKKLESPVVRVVGEAGMKVTKVAFSPGAAGARREMRALERDDVEALLVGETREWETVEYAADAVTQGREKALIVIGHIPSEQAGMQECARWLKGFVKDVPVEFVGAKEPWWSLK
jgi:putative NIF3 family GTP cyclohydrolase 1 type 2